MKLSMTISEGKKLVQEKVLTAKGQGSVYFTKNSGYRSLKNCSCVTVFGSCSVTLTIGEPLGDVFGSANHDFRTSITRISDEIDASQFFSTIKYLTIITDAGSPQPFLLWPTLTEHAGRTNEFGIGAFCFYQEVKADWNRFL